MRPSFSVLRRFIYILLYRNPWHVKSHTRMNARNDDNDDDDTVVSIIALTIGRRRRRTGLEHGQSTAFSPTRCETQSMWSVGLVCLLVGLVCWGANDDDDDKK
jgi:hypothetical protein